MPDAEIEAMGRVVDALSELEDDQRDRVLRWAAERYSITMARTRGSWIDRDGDGAKDDLDDVQEDQGKNRNEDSGKPEFEDFAELYDAAEPNTDAERALVASYWTQIHDGKATFGSQEVNKILKELGHGIGAINKAMSANIEVKPALILQVTRSGSTRQARKKYKLTDAGKKWVLARLA